MISRKEVVDNDSSVEHTNGNRNSNSLARLGCNRAECNLRSIKMWQWKASTHSLFVTPHPSLYHRNYTLKAERKNSQKSKMEYV